MYIQGNQSNVGNVNIGGYLAVKGELKLFSPTTVGTTSMSGTDPAFGGFQRHPVSNVNYNSNTSHVFLTPRGNGNTSIIPFYSVENTSYDGSGNGIPYAASTFYIVSRQLSNSAADTTTFNYLIVNQS